MSEQVMDGHAILDREWPKWRADNEPDGYEYIENDEEIFAGGIEAGWKAAMEFLSTTAAREPDISEEILLLVALYVLGIFVLLFAFVTKFVL